MSNKCVNIVVLLILFFWGVSPGLAVSAEPSNAELEFMVDSAREELEAQGEAVKDLREKYEAILKRKKEIQRFIDEENRKNALPVAKKLKKQALDSPGVSIETPKNILETDKNEAVERNRAQERAIAQLEKNSQCRLLPKKTKALKKKIKCPVKQELTKKTREEMKREEPEELARKKEEADRQALDMKRPKELEALKRKKAAQALEEEKIKKLAEQESARQAQEELKRKKLEELERQKLAAAKQKEQALLDKKLEQERLQSEEKENSLIAERERQLKLLLEANNKSKHDKYVSGLKALEERQNNLLKQSKNFELELNQEEESLKLAEKEWAEAFQRLWEKLSE